MYSYKLCGVQRVEIIEWINQGGGAVVEDPGMQTVNFIVECHGVKHKVGITKSTFVSSHWVKSCLEVCSKLL